MRSFIISALVITCAACGGGGSAMEGIYTIDVWNLNPTACTDPGPSRLGSGYTHFYVKYESIPGLGAFLNVKACDTQAECEMESRDPDTIHLGDFAGLEEGGDDNGWTNHSAFAFNVGGTCMGSVDDDHLTRDGETAVLLRMEAIDVTFPAQGDMCPDAVTEAAAVGQPCTSLETVHGVFLEDI